MVSSSKPALKVAVLASLVALPFMFGANCTPPLGPAGDPAGSPLPAGTGTDASGAPIRRPPTASDPITLSANKSVVVTGLNQATHQVITLKIIAPSDIDPSFFIIRIAQVLDANGNVLFEAASANDVAPAQFGTLGPLQEDLTFTYTPPELVVEPLKVLIGLSAPAPADNAKATTSAQAIPGEIVLATFTIEVLPPDSVLRVSARAFPRSITVDGNGGPSATTTTLRAEVSGGKLIPGTLYEVFWTAQGLPLTPAGTFETLVLDDTDNNGLDDAIVAERAVTANELAALTGTTGEMLLNVTARDQTGLQINDVVSVVVNPALTVAATMTPEVFVGDGELRTMLAANVSGGAGAYEFQWSSDPVIPGLFDEVDTTAQQISVRARDLGDQQVSFTVVVTDGAGNTASALARRGGGDPNDPPPPVPDDLVVSIATPPTCSVVGGTMVLDGVVSGGVAPLTFQWSAACGSFTDATAEDTTWTAPADGQTCSMTFTATDKNGLSRSQTIAVTTAAPIVSFVAAGSDTDPETVVAADADGHQVQVALSLPPGCALQTPVTVDVVDLGTGTATVGADYTALAVPTTVTFPAGSVNGDTQAVDVILADDPIVEGPETIRLGLTNATGGAVLGSTVEHAVTITDDDQAVLTIADASAVEGGTMDFIVSLSAPSSQDVSVFAATSPGTAGAADYTSNAQVITFVPGGPLTLPFSVTTLADDLNEGDETFYVNLMSASGATVADGQGVGTIVDDDLPP
ncbi:MAG: hypothetical protein HY718_04495, partial [Planctomycetes bacterium]|nr:hypothetical protein [Planctomycetota bacterium]